MAVRRGTGAIEMRAQSDDMRKLYVALKGVEGNLRVSLRRRIVAATKPLADDVKHRTTWSHRIPGAVKAKPSFSARSAGVSVIVDPKRAPHAAPLNNGGRGGTFRRQVYGRAWVNQPARPFWDDSIEARAPGMETEMAQILDDVAREAGFN